MSTNISQKQISIIVKCRGAFTTVKVIYIMDALKELYSPIKLNFDYINRIALPNWSFNIIYNVGLFDSINDANNFLTLLDPIIIAKLSGENVIEITASII